MIAGYIEELHDSRKYVRCLCSECYSWIGLRDKEGKWLMQMDHCGNGHEIDWKRKEQRKETKGHCKNCHHLIVAWGNERHEYECGEHRNDVPAFERNGLVYNRHCYVELNDTCEYWTEIVEPIRNTSKDDNEGIQMQMDIIP